MLERIKRRIHRVEQKLDRLFGGGEPTNPIDQAPGASSPRSAQIGHTARAGIRTLFDVLSASAGEFGPLKTAIGGLLRCIEIHESQVAAHEEYHRLKIDLNNVCQEIVGYVGEAAPPSMESSIAKLAEGIQEEINAIDQKIGRSTLGRYAEAIGDAGMILARYQRIQKHLDAFALSAGMKIWQIVDDHATRARLKELPNAPAAQYCSIESCGLGRNECTPNTRVDVIEQLRDWARDSESKRVYWLNGMAGTGKTTIAYSLCSQLERAGQLAASFFCSRQLPACRDVGTILPSIAYQLASSSRPFRYELSSALERDPELHNRPADQQFHRLIAAPLRKVQSQLRGNLIIVIDALDECQGADSVGQMLSALLADVSDLPMKIFLTSRPNPEILSQMESEQSDGVRSELRLHSLERSVHQEKRSDLISG